MIGERISIEIPSRGRHVATVRRFFASLASECRELTLSKAEVAEIQLVLQEACINSIRHGQSDLVGVLKIVFEISPEQLVIEVHDRGRGFDPESVPVPIAESLQEGGYGVYIIQQSMDRVEARRDAKGFVLSMTKLLGRHGSEAARG